VKNAPSINSLIQLIDDPDDLIYADVRDKLISQGASVIPFLEDSSERFDYGGLFKTRIQDLIDSIQRDRVYMNMNEWIRGNTKDLLEGALIIARVEYPELDEAEIRHQLSTIRSAIWLELNEEQTAFEKIRIFNKVFYGKFGFSGERDDYYNPDNSFLNRVIETKKGNPISLSIIYSVVAQSLDLPVYGINLPNHFVLGYLDENDLNGLFDKSDRSGVLFYINAFSKGGVFNKKEIAAFLENIDRKNDRQYYEPCSNSAILSRMLLNLMSAYRKRRDEEKFAEIKQLRNLFDLKV